MYSMIDCAKAIPSYVDVPRPISSKIINELLVAYLKQADMTIDDINFVSMSIADAKAALDGGSIDAALVAGPTAYKSKQQGYHLVTNGKGLTDAVIAVAVREDFYNEHKEELEVFMNAQESIIEFINENHDETMDIVAEELDLDKAVEYLKSIPEEKNFAIKLAKRTAPSCRRCVLSSDFS